MNSEPTFIILRKAIGLSLSKRRTWYVDPPLPNPDDPPPPPPAKPGTLPSPAPEKTLTQAEADAIIGNRVKEAKSAAVTDLLKELGFDKADDLKAMITDAKKRADDEKSEVEKANDAAKKAADKTAALEQQLADEKQARLIDRRNAAIVAAASKAHNPKDVLRWAEDDGKTLLEKVMGEDGAIDDAAVKKLVEGCQKAMPHYFGAGGPGSPSNKDGRPPSADASRVQELLAQSKRHGL